MVLRLRPRFECFLRVATSSALTEQLQGPTSFGNGTVTDYKDKAGRPHMESAFLPL